LRKPGAPFFSPIAYLQAEAEENTAELPSPSFSPGASNQIKRGDFSFFGDLVKEWFQLTASYRIR